MKTCRTEKNSRLLPVSIICLATSSCVPIDVEPPRVIPTVVVADFETLKLDLGNGETMDFVRIPSGSFLMGSDEYWSENKPAHHVTLTQDFYIGKYEVTQAQWRAVMGTSPSRYGECDNCPVESITWDDAGAFNQSMSTLTGRSIRLPTEAEWEYAARAGTTRKYPFGDSLEIEYSTRYIIESFAWFQDSTNSGGRTNEHGRINAPQKVGELLPNFWGLYDTMGNVQELCNDWYDSEYYYTSPAIDPLGPGPRSRHVRRGGSYSEGYDSVRVYKRWHWWEDGSPKLGFRVVTPTDGGPPIVVEDPPAERIADEDADTNNASNASVLIELVAGVPEVGVTITNAGISIDARVDTDIPPEIEQFFDLAFSSEAGFKSALPTHFKSVELSFRGGPGPWNAPLALLNEVWDKTFGDIGDPFSNWAALEWLKGVILAPEPSEIVTIAVENEACFPIDDVTLGVINFCTQPDGTISVSAGEGVIIGADWNPETGVFSVALKKGWSIKFLGIQHSADTGVELQFNEGKTEINLVGTAGVGLGSVRTRLVTKVRVYEFVRFPGESIVWDGDVDQVVDDCSGDYVGAYTYSFFSDNVSVGFALGAVDADGGFLGHTDSGQVFSASISNTGRITGQVEEADEYLGEMEGFLDFSSCSIKGTHFDSGLWVFRRIHEGDACTHDQANWYQLNKDYEELCFGSAVSPFDTCPETVVSLQSGILLASQAGLIGFPKSLEEFIAGSRAVIEPVVERQSCEPPTPEPTESSDSDPVTPDPVTPDPVRTQPVVPNDPIIKLMIEGIYGPSGRAGVFDAGDIVSVRMQALNLGAKVATVCTLNVFDSSLSLPETGSALVYDSYLANEDIERTIDFQKYATYDFRFRLSANARAGGYYILAAIRTLPFDTVLDTTGPEDADEDWSAAAHRATFQVRE